MADDGPVSEQPALDGAVRPTGRPNARLGKTIADMVRSMVVVLAVVGAIMLVTWRPQPDPVREVDVAPVLALAASQAEYPILVPVGMEGYRPTSARWEPTRASSQVPVWHVGFVTGQGQYVQVSQAATTDPGFVAEQTGQAAVAGDVVIDGATWQQQASNEALALVRVSDGVTTVVTGTVPLEELSGVVRSLRPGP
jgi:hypothetical protein